MKIKLHLPRDSNKAILIRTFIFTFGHYWIDVMTNHFITGAPIKLAMVSGFVGPILNAVWYYMLDKFFFTKILNFSSKQ